MQSFEIIIGDEIKEQFGSRWPYTIKIPVKERAGIDSVRLLYLLQNCKTGLESAKWAMEGSTIVAIVEDSYKSGYYAPDLWRFCEIAKSVERHIDNVCEIARQADKYEAILK